MRMRRTFIIVSLALLSMTTMAAAPMMMEMGVAELVEPEQSITISMQGNSVFINGAAGMTLEVVSLTGRQVATIKIDNPAQRVELNLPKGCYILKVGKVVRKVTLR